MNPIDGNDARMNPEGLYREEVFSDRRIGTIQRLTPVDRHGELDTSRPVLFVGQASLMTPAGSLPISFDIDAKSLGEAAEKFTALAQDAVQDTMRELQDLRRESSSGLIVPGQGSLPGGSNPDGFPGGGIQIR